MSRHRGLLRGAPVAAWSAMAPLAVLAALALLLSATSPALAQSPPPPGTPARVGQNNSAICGGLGWFNREKYNYTACAVLGDTGQFFLAWNFTPSGAGNSVGSLTTWFQGPTEKAWGWTAWGINVNKYSMINASAVVGYSPNNSPGNATAQPFIMTSQSQSGVNPGNAYLNVNLASIRVEVSSQGLRMRVQSTLDNFQAGSDVYVIWHAGPGYKDGNLEEHAHLHVKQGQLVNFQSSYVEVYGGTPNLNSKVTHAWLAGIGFGVLLPFGALVARHMKQWLDPIWFFSHIAIQATGYLLGVVGWGYGIWLSTQTTITGSTQSSHYGIGVTIFVFATLQVLTPLGKPNKGTPLRLYWNIVHWTFGYLTIILSVVNVFLGFQLMGLEGISYGGWQTVYIFVVAIIGGLLILLEPLSWYMYFQNRDEEYDDEDGTEHSGSEEDDEEEDEEDEDEEEEDEDEEEDEEDDEDYPDGEYSYDDEEEEPQKPGKGR